MSEAAARQGDEIAHGTGMVAMLGGALVGALVGAAILAAAPVSVAIGAVIVGGGVAGGALSMKQLARGMSTAFQLPEPPTGKITVGSTDTYINGKPAARAGRDLSSPCSGQPLTHGRAPAPVLIAEGSGSVYVNGQPLARLKDKLVCGAHVKSASENVFIGGRTQNAGHDVQDIERWIESGFEYLGVAALVGAGGLAAAAGMGAFAIFGAATVGVGQALEGMGKLGDRLGPGYGDMLQGAAGLGMLLASPRLMRKAAPQKEAAMRATHEGGVNKNGQRTPRDCDVCTSGEPISLVTGEEILVVTDFTVPGVLPLAWERRYKSSNPDNVGLGYGWTHPLAEKLVFTEIGIEYHTCEARIICLPHVAEGETYTDGLEKLSIERIDNGAYLLRDLRGPPHQRVFRAMQSGSELVLCEIIDQAGNRIALHYHEGRLHALSTGGGSSWQFDYTSAGHVSTVRRLTGPDQQKILVSYEYDDAGDLVGVRDAAGVREGYAYSNHLIVRRSLKSGYNLHFAWSGDDSKARCVRNWGDPIDGVPTYDYVFQWDVPKRSVSITDSRGGIECFEFNDAGLPLHHRNQEGGITYYEYDEQGNLLKKTDPLGHVQSFGYDEFGNLVRVSDAMGGETTLTRDARGQVVELLDAAGGSWRNTYNELGQLVVRTNPLGQSVRYQYNAQGLINAQTNPLGKTWHYIWDPNGRLIAERDPRGRHTRYRYDVDGNLLSVTRPDGERTEYSYDERGHCIRVKTPGGHVRQFLYNELGLITECRDSDSQVIRYAYDGLSQVVRRTDALGHSLAYHYDGERNLIGLTNEKGDRYHIKYDLNERIVEETGFDGRTQRYEYNRTGQLTASIEIAAGTDSALSRLSYVRNPRGQLLKLWEDQLDGSEPSLLSEFTYDALGRMCSACNSDRRLQWRFDAMGRVIEDHQDLQVLRHVYDDLGQRIETALPTGERIAYQYDDRGGFSALAFNGMEVARITRDVLGRETSRRYGNQLNTESRFDPQGRLWQQSTAKAQSPMAVIARHYRYNALGQLAQVDDLRRGSTQYFYDTLDRLTRVEGANSEVFVHDPAGNLLASDSDSAASNRLRCSGDVHHQYDERGNRIAQRRGTYSRMETRFSYDSCNQLIAAEHAGITTRYAYDALGRRIRKSNCNGVTEFWWNGDVLLSETSRSGDSAQCTTKVYCFEPDSFRPLAAITDGVVHYYHLDHLGTPQELSDARGVIVWAAQYKAYGSLALAFDSAVENNLRFQGQYFDAETGLHYNRFRYYDPKCGRFINQDPIGLMGGVNSYRYVPNPVAWVDPLGLSCKENSWNAFQNAHKGRFANSSEMSKAYSDLKVNQSPWPIGYDYQGNVRTMQPGETFRMIVDNGKTDMPGRFGTLDTIPDTTYGRQQLAIKEAWKPSLENVVEYKVVKPFDVYEGPVGPQVDGGKYLSGGGTQITFKDADVWQNARPNKYNGYTSNPYLDVLSVTPLPP